MRSLITSLMIIISTCWITMQITGCDYRMSQEEHDAYLRDAHREAEEILGLQPGSLSDNPLVGGGGAESVEKIRKGIRYIVYPELNIANRWQVRFYRNLDAHGLEFHSNSCKQWSKFWYPVQNHAGVRIWADRLQDELAKPEHKRNIKEVMRYDDGSPVVFHRCYWNPQYRMPK